MEDAGRELRDIRAPLHNGEKTINIRRFAFLQLHFFPKGTRQHLEIPFFLLIVRTELLKVFIGELVRNVVLIEPLADSIQPVIRFAISRSRCRRSLSMTSLTNSSLLREAKETISRGSR